MAINKRDDLAEIGKNTLLYFMSQIIPKIVAVIVVPLYSYFITPGDLGIYMHTSSYISIIAILSTLGLNTYYMRDYAHNKNTKEFNGTIFWFLMGWNSILIIIAMASAPFILSFLGAPYDFFPYMFLALTFQFFNSMEIIPMRTFRISGDVKKYLIIVIMKSIFHAGFGLLCVCVFKLGLRGRFYAEIINAALFAVIYILYMIKKSYFKVNKVQLVKAIRFSIPLMPSDLLSTGTTSICTIIIEKALSITQLGIYSIGVSFSTMINAVTTSFFYAMEPELYIQAATKNYHYYLKRFKTITILINSWASVGGALFVREVAILLLAESYHNAWPITQVLGFSYILGSLKLFYNQRAIISGKTKIVLLANIANLVGSVATCGLLLPFFREAALGWSYFVGYAISFAILYIGVRDEKVEGLQLWKDFLMIGLAGFVIFGSRYFHRFDLLVCLVLKSILFLLYSIVLLFVYKIRLGEIVKLLVRRKVTNE